MRDRSRLYQNLVIQHSQHPQNYREILNPTHSAKGYNRVCGDAITIYLNVAHERITDVSFQGDCCAVCKCSASLLTERAKGASLEDFSTLFDAFKTLLEQDDLTPDQQKTLGDMRMLGGIKEFPARIPCANLSWHTLHAALQQKPQISTE